MKKKRAVPISLIVTECILVVLFVFLYRKSDAILGWFERKFHRETRVKEQKTKDEFLLEVVGPDGSIVSKGVKREGTDAPPAEKQKGENE